MRITIRHRLNQANNKVKIHTDVILTKEEKQSVQKKWGSFVNRKNISCYSFYKYYHKEVNPNLAPNDFYLLVEMYLNGSWATGYLRHKANLQLFIPKENRPRTIINCINGHFSTDEERISKGQAEELLKCEKYFVFKPAIQSGGGRGVRKYENPDSNTIKSILENDDFIVQEIIRQHPFFAAFNDSSVNTIRMETLNLHDKCTVLSSFVRIGSAGSFTDNITGREGVVVGISDEGELSEFGLTKDYQKVLTSPSGLDFNGLVVPNYEAIKEKIIGFHKYYPAVNIINWDIAIGENGEVIIVEINLGNMNPRYHQIFNGPIFRERTGEVIEYMRQFLNKKGICCSERISEF